MHTPALVTPAVSAKPSSRRDRWVRQVESLVVAASLEVCGPEVALHESFRAQLEPGRRVRALLPLLVADVMEVQAEALLPFAAACEVVHAASLVSDGARTDAWARFGTPHVFNLGDALLFHAVELVQRAEAPAERRLRAADRLTRAGLASAVSSGRLLTEGLLGAAELCGANAETLAALERSAGALASLIDLCDAALVSNQAEDALEQACALQQQVEASAPAKFGNLLSALAGTVVEPLLDRTNVCRAA